MIKKSPCQKIARFRPMAHIIHIGATLVCNLVHQLVTIDNQSYAKTFVFGVKQKQKWT